jgi:hypothetical protein
MADLRPLGSEKLQGMDKIKRILEIAKFNETPKQDINENATTNYTIQLADGFTYGIVKERQGYIIKKGLNESTLDYSDPIRERKYFRSYADAMKKLNLTAAEMNRLFENEEGISLIGEQAGQKKKFVLKLPKAKGNQTPDVGSDVPPTVPTPPAPPAEPTPEPPAMDTEETPEVPPMGGEETPDMGDTEMPDMGVEETPDMEEPKDDDFDLEGEGPQSSFKSIQRLTGKLSQRLRQFEKDKELESDDIKYVLNSIISALNLDNLDEEDKDDILSKFDEEETGYDEEGPGELDLPSEEDFDMGGEPEMGSEEPMPTEPKEDFYMVGESVVEKVLSKYFNVTDEENRILEEKKKKKFIQEKIKTVEVKKEILKLSESVKQIETSLKLIKENAKFVGKTNKENLVFVKDGKQIKVNQRGQII